MIDQAPDRGVGWDSKDYLKWDAKNFLDCKLISVDNKSDCIIQKTASIMKSSANQIKRNHEMTIIICVGIEMLTQLKRYIVCSDCFSIEK